VASPLLEKKPEGRLYSQLPFIVGDCFFRQQNWEGAIAPLEAFVTPRITTDAKKKVTVTPDPNMDTALMQLAMASDRTQSREKAKSYLKLLISSYGKPTPQLPLALAEQGRLAFEDDDLKLARQALETFLAEDAKAAEPFSKNAPAQRARVHYYLGWVDAKEEKHEAAAGHFGEVVKLGDNPVLAPDAALQQGIAMVNSKNFEAAATHFPAMLQKYPQHEKLERVVYYSGLSLARQKKWPEAAVHFKRVAQTFPKSQFADQALYEWAWCERAAKRMSEATKLYEELLAKHPDSVLVVKVQSELAELNLDSGDQDQVIARLTEALTKVKDAKLRQDMRYQLASAHFKKGDHEKAAGQFEGLLTDYPKSELRASILFQAGESRLKLGETVSARDHFAAAFALPDSSANIAESITMRLGETQALTGQHEDARKTYATFLEKFKDSRWTRNAQFGLAFAMESAGDSEGAIPEYKKLLSDKKMVDLWTVRSRFQTGECYFNLQKYDDAVAEFVAVQINFKKYPSWQAKALLEIGRVLLTQDKTDQAKERFKDVIQSFGKEKAAVVAQQYLDKLRADGK
jgi:TolA-binding protein